MKELNKKRAICFFLGILTLFMCLQGCQLIFNPSGGDSSDETATDTSDPAESAIVYLINEGVCDYTVVYAKGSDDAKTAANKLAQAFQVKYKITLKVSDSGSVSYDADAKEIYIGNTGFAESVEAAKNLNSKYAFCITGIKNKFVIVAEADGSLTEAVEYYVNDLLPNCVSFNPNTGKASVKIPECVVKNATGSSALHSSISIGGADLKKYKIVYEEESEKLIEEYAKMLRDAIVSTYGAHLTVVGDQSSEESEYEILIGNTNRQASSAFAEAQDVGYLKYDIGALPKLPHGNGDEGYI